LPALADGDWDICALASGAGKSDDASSYDGGV